jgi:selenocysteine lyase/cysteine desulfurase
MSKSINSMGRRGFLSLSSSALLLAASHPVLAGESKTPSRFKPGAEDTDAELFAAARRELTFSPDITYCNTGTLGAMPRDVLNAQVEGLKQLEAELPDWPYYTPIGSPLSGYQKREDIRTDVGNFMGGDMDEIALTQNATMGMNFLANGMTYTPGDEILTTDQEHGGGIGPFKLMAKRYGAVVKEINLDNAVVNGHEGVLEAFASAITPKTRVLMFSQITSGFGYKLPARELCALAKEHGIFSIVDGAQVVGQLPVDVKDLDCDAYVTSPHKWLLAPKGTGVLYIRREKQDEIWATLASYNYDNYEDGALRFMQYGTGSPAVIYGLKAALEFNRKIGIERIARWNFALTEQLQEGLRDIPNARIYSGSKPELWAGATTFGLENKTSAELQDALWAGKIRVRAQGSNRRVRLSAHLYVNPDDIARTLDIVRSLAKA